MSENLIEPCDSCGRTFETETERVSHISEQHLGPDCGPHCGIQTTGGRVVHKRHHACKMCHPK